MVELRKLPKEGWKDRMVNTPLFTVAPALLASSGAMLVWSKTCMLSVCGHAWYCVFCEQFSVLSSWVPAGHPLLSSSPFYSSSRHSREGRQTSPSPSMQTSSRGSWLQSLRIKTGKDPQRTWFCSAPCVVCYFLPPLLCFVLKHTYVPSPAKSRGHKKVHRTWQRL